MSKAMLLAALTLAVGSLYCGTGCVVREKEVVHDRPQVIEHDKVIEHDR